MFIFKRAKENLKIGAPPGTVLALKSGSRHVNKEPIIMWV
jgi:hypothetical protein